MANTGETGSRSSTLSLGSRRVGERKTTVDGGHVTQDFRGGRKKDVAVEHRIKKPRLGQRRGQKDPAKEKTFSNADRKSVQPGRESADNRQSSLGNLSAEERAKRSQALAAAQVAQREELERYTAEAKARAEAEKIEARRKAEAERIERERQEEEQRKQREAEAKRLAEEEARRKKEEHEAQQRMRAEAAQTPDEEQAETVKGKKGKQSKAKPAGKPGPKYQEGRRQKGKLTLERALSDVEGERTRSEAAQKRLREKLRQQQPRTKSGPAGAPGRQYVRDIIVPESIVVSELAVRMAVRGGEVVKKLMEMGKIVTITQTIDADTAELLVGEFGHRTIRVTEADVEVGLKQDDDADMDKVARAPVVTVMGHVDHGKTSLLDALRKTDIVSGETGGITQHIGAYQVTLANKQKITFLDTPGHESFTAMRARGANVTDIVVLVVAADDSVMPQTREAIDHARSAKASIIIAINKCDLPAADPERVKQDLLKHDVLVESLGGDIQVVEVSAMTGEGLDRLTEAILLQAEVLELRANPNRDAEGHVVEAQLDKGRGAVSTVLVSRGTLDIGDIVVAGKEWGRVKALLNEHGDKVKSAGPAVPVEILGLSGAPIAGDEFFVVENEKRAREIAAYREEQVRLRRIKTTGRTSIDMMFLNSTNDNDKELPVVVKADVQGSVEAISYSLESMSTEEVRPRIILASVGGITENDVNLAKASGAVIFGFNVRANGQARKLAEKEGVELIYSTIIYNLVDQARAKLTGLLEPTSQERILGMAQVLDTFDISRIGIIAGCRVQEGIIRQTSRVRLLRNGEIRFDGAIKTLRHHKDQVREIKQGVECGIQLDNFYDIAIGDEIEAYEISQVARTL